MRYDASRIALEKSTRSPRGLAAALAAAALTLVGGGGYAVAAPGAGQAPPPSKAAREAEAKPPTAAEAKPSTAAKAKPPTAAKAKPDTAAAARKAAAPVVPAAVTTVKKQATDPGWTLNRKGAFVTFHPILELGFIAPVAHHITFGQDGSRLDYLEEGGQDNLFFFWRISLQLRFKGRHVVTALYQPLNLLTKEVIARDLTVDGLTFPAGTPMEYRYGFDFYRLSYRYEWGPWKGFSIGVGGGLQLRNATIEFQSADGTLGRSNRNIGPVPLIILWNRYQPLTWLWMEAEIYGFWAGDKIINGSTEKVEGAIVDSSIRLGFEISSFLDVYLNVRYLGGGAEGYSDPKEFSDGYTKNWIHTLIFSFGLRMK